MLKQWHCEQVFLRQYLKDLITSLNELQMSLFGVPNDLEDAMFTHPRDQLLHCEDFHGTIGHLSVANDGVKLLDSKDPTLK